MPTDLPQPVVAMLTRAAIFLVVTVKSGPEHDVAVRSLCDDLAALLRAVGFRGRLRRTDRVLTCRATRESRLLVDFALRQFQPFIGALPVHRIAENANQCTRTSRSMTASL